MSSLPFLLALSITPTLFLSSVHPADSSAQWSLSACPRPTLSVFLQLGHVKGMPEKASLLSLLKSLFHYPVIDTGGTTGVAPSFTSLYPSILKIPGREMVH